MNEDDRAGLTDCLNCIHHGEYLTSNSIICNKINKEISSDSPLCFDYAVYCEHYKHK